MSEMPPAAPAAGSPSKALTVADKALAVKTYIEKNSAAIAQALPRIGLTPEALTRTALSQIYRNPTLMECDKTSLMRSIVEAASLGLSFSLGRAYLVPYRNNKKNRMEAQLIPGYLGLADIARRSGEVASITAQAVYKGDEFNYEFGLERDELHHKPVSDPDDANLTHVYAIVRFKNNGGYQVVVMTRKQVESIRKRSKSASNGPWVTDYAAMAKKTVIKQVLKLCPASIDLMRAIDLDERHDAGKPQSLAPEVFGDDDTIDVEPSSDTETAAAAPAEEQAPAAEQQPRTRTQTVKDALTKAKKTGDKVATAQDDGETRAAQWDATYNVLTRVARSHAEADVEISAATGGRIQSIDKLKSEGTIADLKAVETHLLAIAGERESEQ